MNNNANNTANDNAKLTQYGWNGVLPELAFKRANQYAFEREVERHEQAMARHWGKIIADVHADIGSKIKRGELVTPDYEAESLDCAIVKWAGVTPERSFLYPYYALPRFAELLGLDPDSGFVKALYHEIARDRLTIM